MTPSLQSLDHSITRRLGREMEQHTSSIRQAVTSADKARQILSAATYEFLVTGVANLSQLEFPHYVVPDWTSRGFRWSTYFERVAKENHRPFVRTTTTIYNYDNPGTVTLLSLPRRRYLEPVTAPFLLAVEAGFVHRGYTVDDEHYTFKNDDARALLSLWREKIKVVPEMRRALRLQD